MKDITKVRIDDLVLFRPGRNHYNVEVEGETVPLTTVGSAPGGFGGGVGDGAGDRTGDGAGGRGKRFCIVSGQHGNEWNGIRALMDLRESLNEVVGGSVTLIPYINPPALAEKRRTGPDGIDMNRAYPDDTTSGTGRLGNALYSEIFLQHDYLIDIHSGGPGVFFEHVRVPFEEDVEYAKYLLFDHVWVRREKEGLIAPVLRKRGVRSSTIEIGGGRRTDLQAIERCNAGLVNLLKHRGVLVGTPEEPGRFDTYRERTICKVKDAGILEVLVERGDRVRKGQAVGRLKRFVDGKVLTVECERNGTVGYVRVEPAVMPGDSVVHILV